MSYIAVGVTAAGVVASVASKAMEKKSSGPAFEYGAAENDLGKFREQVAARDKYNELEKQERERERGLADAERRRQGWFTDESNVSVNKEIDRFNDIEGQLGGRAQQLGDYFATNSGGMPTGVMPSASGRTAEYEAQRLADASAFNTQQNNAQARVRSFGDVWGDIGTGSLQDKTHMTNVADFKQGSRALLPAEMRPIVNRERPRVDANNFGAMYGPGEEPDNTFSDILGGVGSIATSYGMSGFGGFGQGREANLSGFTTQTGPLGPGEARLRR
jgi:hypothetical protein